MNENIGLWIAHYRQNPHLFVQDYLQITLKTFQKVLIYMMSHMSFFVYIATRGQGKTWLVSLYAVVRGILYPGSKVVIVSGTLTQAIQTIQKIENELMVMSPVLKNEIEEISTGRNNPIVKLRNGSTIKAVVSTDNARGNRANVLIIDEYRLVDRDTINLVLRQFATTPRQPGFLKNSKYSRNVDKYTEPNQQIYMSSAWFKSHWSWDLKSAYTNNMLNGRPYFACTLPYYVSIKEGLYTKEAAYNEMLEPDFDPFQFKMELGAMFYGESSNAFFTYDSLEKAREVPLATYENSTYALLKDKNFEPPPRREDEYRVLSCDIAVMTGDDRDITSMIVLDAIPTNRGYEKRQVYIETLDGGHSGSQALRIRQLYEELNCDYIVLDIQGVGVGVWDFLNREQVCPDTGKRYEPLGIINNERMSDRYEVDGASKVVYSINASERLNSEMAILLRNDITSGKLKLLAEDAKAIEVLNQYKGYGRLSAEHQNKLEAPYHQTTSLIYEMINLEAITKGAHVKLSNTGKIRKDRYTSLAYGNYAINKIIDSQRTYGDSFDWSSFSITSRGGGGYRSARRKSPFAN